MSANYPGIRSKQEGKVGLSPPWVTLQRTLSFTVGQSSQVMVAELTGGGEEYTIKAVTFNGENAQSLANVLKSSYSFGNVLVSVVITDIDGKKYEPTRQPTIDDLKRALLNNSLIYNVAEKQIACQPVVVQFWNDDISTPDGFTSMLASAGFSEVVVDIVNVYTVGREFINI